MYTPAFFIVCMVISVFKLLEDRQIWIGSLLIAPPDKDISIPFNTLISFRMQYFGRCCVFPVGRDVLACARGIKLKPMERTHNVIMKNLALMQCCSPVWANISLNDNFTGGISPGNHFFSQAGKSNWLASFHFT